MAEIREEIAERVSKWFGEPVLAVEDELLAIFQKAQIQLVSGLIEEINGLEVDIKATEKHIESTGLTGDELEQRVLDMQIEADDRLDVLSDVTALLEHKKQELERLQ